MQVLIKAAISIIIILAATEVGKRFPSVAGLIAMMPITGALVMAWIYLENEGDQRIMGEFAKGALLGLIPSILFYLAAFFCLSRKVSLPTALLASFAVWLAAAFAHQWILK